MNIVPAPHILWLWFWTKISFLLNFFISFPISDSLFRVFSLFTFRTLVMKENLFLKRKTWELLCYIKQGRIYHLKPCSFVYVVSQRPRVKLQPWASCPKMSYLAAPGLQWSTLSPFLNLGDYVTELGNWKQMSLWTFLQRYSMNLGIDMDPRICNLPRSSDSTQMAFLRFWSNEWRNSRLVIHLFIKYLMSTYQVLSAGDRGKNSWAWSPPSVRWR